MTPDVILDMAREAGLTVWTDGTRLGYKPAHHLTPELRALLVQYKPALLAHLHRAAGDGERAIPNCMMAAGEGVQELDGLPGDGMAKHHPMPEDRSGDPARWCWAAVPELDAPMNEGEIAAFTARVVRFISLGLTASTAEEWAHTLKLRDREGDERHICLECTHLTRSVTCTAWRQAGIGSYQPGELALKPQRCPAFRELEMKHD